MEHSAIREALADMLGILQYKVKNNVLTPEDMEAIMDLLRCGCGIQATARDLAGYYHQTEDSVRHLIHRNIFPSPKRRVYYDFSAFQRLVPAKWKKNR